MPVIFVPPPREVECIVQDGRRYCERANLDPHTLGIILIVFIIWGGIFFYGLANDWNDWILAMVSVGPILLFAIGCLML
ncbi:MAG: hypothetical protein BWY21_00325 [Parcubacteria group bacterium ADurb.Bin216]|nr:MAG: hypothetical protein BWY21_00325 [Parcubacteria group bacterium ADurb.Bin216]